MTQLLNEDGTDLGYPRFLKFVGDGVTTAYAGRTATVTISGSSAGTFPVYTLIAGSDAPQAVIDAADYACDGTADQVEINTALAVDDDRPILLVGTFTTSAAIAFTDGVKHDLYGINEDATVIQGNHTGNVLEVHSASTPCEWRMTIANLHIDKGTSTPARGISVTNGAYLTFRNVRARRCTTNHYSYFGVHNAYYDCMFTDGTTGTQLTGAASAYSNLNRFYNCVWRANDVGTLFSARTERCSFFGCGWEDMASTDVGVKFANDTTIRGHGFTDCWFEGVGASVYPMDFLGGRNISFVRPRFAIANTQAVVKVSGFAGKNVTIVDPHVDDGASLAGLPQGISVTSAGDNRTFNVTAFGALCDGTTDDTDAIQQAIDAAGTTGGTITGPKGTYLLSQQGSISHDSMSPNYCLVVNGNGSTTDANGTHGEITFDFPRGTVFKLAASQPDTSILILVNGSSASRRTAATTMRGITFDGNYANQGAEWTDNGLVTTLYAQDILVENCVFQNAVLLGMQVMRDSRAVVIRNNRFDGTHSQPESHGTSLRCETQDVLIEGNTFITDALAGRCHLALSCNADIDAQGRQMRVIGNLFAGGFSGSSVDLAGASHCVVQGNVFRDVCDTSGFALGLSVYSNANGTVWEPSWNTITDNIFMNCRQGISLGVGSGTISSVKWVLGPFGNVIANNVFTQDVDGGLRTSLGGANAYPDRFTPAPNGAAVNFVNGIKAVGSALLTTQPVTSATSTTVVNSGGSYGTTQYVNAVVTITAGLGKGQSRVITSHTATALTVPTWDVTPDTTSSFVIHAPLGNNLISGNKLWMTNNTAKAIDLTTAYMVDQVFDNESYGTVAAAPFVYGPNTVYRGNKGWSSKPPFKSGEGTHLIWRDENSGTASVTSGNTSVTVTHGCGRTPTQDQVMVWPLTTNGSATEWWVDTIGATTFVINVDANPAATYSFGWRIFGAM